MIFLNSNITIDNSHVLAVLSLRPLSLADFSSLCSFFPLYFLDPPPFASPLPFITSILTLITTVVLLPDRASGIFSLTLSDSSPPLSWNSNFWGSFVLFRLSYLYLMWQRLSKNPIINVEAKIFNLFACSRSFPWFQESPGNHTWSIHTPHLR